MATYPTYVRPDWPALATELSLALARMTQDAPGASDYAQASAAQARYRAAAIGRPEDDEPSGMRVGPWKHPAR